MSLQLSKLRSEARYLALGDSSNSTDWSDSDLDRQLNIYYEVVTNWAMDASAQWEWDDYSKGTLPEATADLVASQQDYTLPTGARQVRIVSVKDSDGNWQRLHPIDEVQIDISPDEYFEDDGLPIYYDMKGRSIILYPAPSSNDVTTTEGLKIHVSREIDELSQDSDTPSLDGTFHILIAMMAAHHFTMSHDMESREVDLRRKIYGDASQIGMKGELERFYGKRNWEYGSRMGNTYQKGQFR